MGAQQSIHAGSAKIDVNLDLTHQITAALLLPPELRVPAGPLSQIAGRFCLKHPNVFGGGEKLDAVWDKGLCDSNVVITLRRPRPEWHWQQSLVIQNAVTPEIGVHGDPNSSFTRTGSGGINLRRFSVGVDLSEPATSNWLSTTSIKFEHVCPTNDAGLPVAADREGFPITCSGLPHDSMVVLRQENKFATADKHGFSRLNIQVEQGIPFLSKSLIFNRLRFNASKGIKLGRSLLLTSVTGGSIVGDMAPYQAFSIGGPGSVRGYGDGAVGSGRSCLVVNSELTVPLVNGLEAAVFVDCGSDLGSSHLVPGNPAQRRGKPGRGVGMGYGLRWNLPKVHLQLDYAMNAFCHKTLYFGITNLGS